LIVADTSGLLALFNAREPRHRDVVRVIAGQAEPLVVSLYVLAELDYLVATRFGVDAQLTVLAELGGGAYHLAQFDSDDVHAMAAIIDRYRDPDIGVADASLVVLASRHRTRSMLTLDHRHFAVVRPADGGRFRLLP
jgi:predicted nucleic acid-binding protein